ncbi:conserved hypothetical protein [Talaromyces stipitatus ATCC 10500]|uniref:SWIM-type domain-containing protein n=1 Tax=Talaromyces stipitatus (strain ATCC 10500 / CBS 375.48 / QM 6759 / NRRL 1006) TaxID=441959 RepID=B8MLD8_TALSN|nr:uncharacterized protein TSTA_045160 [Talaromyces stipitatus ATCC 10500]EED15053.1 conserved hypothetical protein [Talaromyces stipitatus ATCC 10500]
MVLDIVYQLSVCLVQIDDTILTTLLTTLSKISPPPSNPENNNIFTTLSATDTTQLKNLLLTLHCLFPNEFLLALDILDRGFVKRYITGNAVSSGAETVMFIVQSSSSATSDRDGGGGGEYQVHLRTWNCSCPAFVMACFAMSRHMEDVDYEIDYLLQHQDEAMDAKEESWFGGTIRNPEYYDDRSIPVCKHILACVLVDKCPNLFARKCLTFNVNDTERVNDVAGYCAA